MKARLGDSDEDGALLLGGFSAVALGPQVGPASSTGAGSVMARTRDRFRRVSATTSVPGAGTGGGGSSGGGGSRPRGPISAY